MSYKSSFYQGVNPTPAMSQQVIDQINAAVAAAQTAITASTPTAFAAWLNSLPTTLPATTNTWWNNGGVLSRT